jgi:replicative superfamily II helicase
MLSAAEDLVERGEQVLLFVPDRTTAVVLARTLAGRVRLPIATDAVDELAESENTRMREVLRETLESSIAFHHADMTADEREIVEHGFRAGVVRALVATSTLAMGVNLPAKNVILDGRKWVTSGPHERPYKEDLSKSEYENMSGRAGRLAFTSDFGRSILVTHSPFQAQTWLDHYVGREFEDITPTLKNAPLDDLVLDLVATRKARTRDQLTDLLLASFTGRVHWTEKMGREKFLKAVGDALAMCTEGSLIRASKDGHLTASKVGKVAASRSIGARTAIAFAQWAGEPHAAPPAPIEILTLLGQSAAGAAVYVRVTWTEDRESSYKTDLLSRVEAAGLQARPVFAGYTGTRMALEDDQAKAVKKALALLDWIDEVPTRDIEDRYQTWAGSLKRIGDEYAWLCEGLAAMCGACGWGPVWRKTVEILGERLSHGVKEDALEVMRLRVRRLSRGMIPALRAAGVLDPAAIRAAPEGVLRKAVGRRAVADALRARVAVDRDSEGAHAMTPARELDASRGQATLAPLADAAVRTFLNSRADQGRRAAEPAVPYGAAASVSEDQQPELIVDLAARRIVLWGHSIGTKPPKNLSPQLFLALAALAHRPGLVVSTSTLADMIQRLGHLSRKPVAPDPRDLRYRLLRSLRRALENERFQKELATLVETVPGAGLRLTCNAQLIHATGVTPDPRPHVLAAGACATHLVPTDS